MGQTPRVEHVHVEGDRRRRTAHSRSTSTCTQTQSQYFGLVRARSYIFQSVAINSDSSCHIEAIIGLKYRVAKAGVPKTIFVPMVLRQQPHLRLPTVSLLIIAPARRHLIIVPSWREIDQRLNHIILLLTTLCLRRRLRNMSLRLLFPQSFILPAHPLQHAYFYQ
jgi:hypothetical protein